MKQIINNNKGYMLVEIIVASVIALTMAFFLMEMTLKLVNNNNDYYIESVLLFDKNIVTKEIMDDINSKQLINVSLNQDSSYTLKYDDGTEKILSVNGNTITYGKYKKKLSDNLSVSAPILNNENNVLTISIKAYTNYSKDDYGIKIVVPYKDVEITYPTLGACYGMLEASGMGNLSYAVRNDSPTSFTSTTSDGEHGIYETEDDLGVSCYFRGDVDYNYVKFGKYTTDLYYLRDRELDALNLSNESTIPSILPNTNENSVILSKMNAEPMTFSDTCTPSNAITCIKIADANDDIYWRIVRINGDGTVRLIYDGTQAHANNEESEDRQIGYAPFNAFKVNDYNAHVGYMYGTPNSATYALEHENINDSIIKDLIDNWYENVLLNTTYEQYIRDAIYCNDRTMVTDETMNSMMGATGKGFGEEVTMYSLNKRTEISSEGMPGAVTPTLKCEQVNDRFTKNATINGVQGNDKLDYAIGLLTVDELVFGGGYWYLDGLFLNDETYLHNGNLGYWTMSPNVFYGGSALVFDGVIGVFDSFVVDGSDGVRPSITLASNALQYGSGISTDPFRVE